MAALAQDGAAVALADGAGRLFHVRGIADGHAGEDLRLRDVGGQDRRQGQQLLFQNGDGIVPQKLCPGSGHHHRVHHDVLCAILAQLVRDDGDEAGRGDHADLHGIGEDVRENGVQFLTQELALMANTPLAVMVLMSAWMPAPPLESLPAIVNAVFILISPFRIEVL